MQTVTVAAIIGSTLIALLLTGSSRNTANSHFRFLTFEESEVKVLASDAMALFARGRYLEARAIFRIVAAHAQLAGLTRAAAMNWNNAGGCSLYTLQFKTAQADFTRARSAAEQSNQVDPLATALNSLASLYVQTGQPENAVRVATQALNGPAGKANPSLRAKLLYHVALGQMMLGRFDEARPFYLEAIDLCLNERDPAAAAIAWSGLGGEFVKGNRLAQAETALSEALRLVRTHHLSQVANILAGLARLKSLQGDQRSAAALFDAALAAPPGFTPRYMIFAYRGQFRLQSGNLRGALADFRESRAMASDMRAEMVPADQDRVALEKGLSLIYDGLVDSGNRLAMETGDHTILEETFNAAEQDRLWSLRALIPSPNDWRTTLPERYWELLTRYQALQRTALSGTSSSLETNIAALRLELQQMEAVAAARPTKNSTQSPLAHVRKILDADTVLLSFHISKTSAWVWAVDRERVAAYRLPPLEGLESEVDAFRTALRNGTPSAGLGARLYHDLFGPVPDRFLRHKRWCLEPTGPLLNLPFAALVRSEDSRGPVYLVESADLQSLPGALLAERDSIPADGAFVGVSDPVYNPADARYRGAAARPEFLLARLPNTAAGVQACARAWNSPRPQLLAGADANPERVRAALAGNPAIVHFATHVVTSPGEFRSGLIALSLNPAGEMGLLGPREILARPVTAKLVVMDGCRSAQAEALPGAGLMGLTRAWIGAGAMSVLATQWDIPDDSAQTLMTDFYRVLRASPRNGAAYALREAQMTALRNPLARQSPGTWAGYFLLSRML
jgi:CHAT domain-containing protein